MWSRSLLALTLISVLALGGLVHALLPHTHGTNEAITSLLHSSLRHEEKTFADLVPLAPLFAFISIVSVATVFAGRTLLFYTLLARAKALTPLRRGVLLYRRFG